jgi:hypothetical protein
MLKNNTCVHQDVLLPIKLVHTKESYMYASVCFRTKIKLVHAEESYMYASVRATYQTHECMLNTCVHAFRYRAYATVLHT